MPLTEKILLGDGIIGIFKIIESVDELMQQYAILLNDVPPIDEFKHDRRRKEWLSARILIARLLGFSSFSISYKKTGEPQILHSEYKFISISHSEKYVVVYLHKNKKVGLDVERVNRNFSKVENKYLSPEELTRMDIHPYLRAIYWCCKEAIFKWAAIEGVDFRTQIAISNFDPNETDTINAYFFRSEKKGIILKYLFFDDHILVYTL